MLVLSRKQDQTIHCQLNEAGLRKLLEQLQTRKQNCRVGDPEPTVNIEITVVRATSGVARLGVNAPKEVIVLRDELVSPAESPFDVDHVR